MKTKNKQKNKIPDGWEVKKLGEIISFLSDYTANGSFAGLKENVKYYTEEEYAVLVRTTDLEKEVFIPQRFTDKKGYDFLKKTSLFGGELIMANVGNIGKVYKVPEYNDFMTLAPNTYLIKLNNEFVDNDYIYQKMLTTKFKNDVLRMVGGGGGLVAINKNNFRSIKINLPPLPEQKRIVGVLEVWDEVLEKLKRKIEVKKNIKKYLMQNLLTGKKRIDGFSGEWKNKQIGKILDYEQPTNYIVESTDYEDKFKTPVLTAGKTFILGYTNEKNNIFPKEKLPVIIFDDFTTANKFVNFEFKVKSSAMKILKNKDKNISDITFIFGAMQLLNFQVGEHKRNYLSEYQFLDIKLPSLEEQKAIADILMSADQELEELLRKQKLLEEQKRFLLNNLISGEIRVAEDLV